MTSITTNDLGLPLEYQQKPEHFDANNGSEETKNKNALIERLLKEQHVKSVLDMTCGTGSQVFFLHKHGYEVTGSDFSPDLIKQANAKAAEQNIDITFLDGDMRDLQAGQFDAVITIFNAVGHLVKSDFAKALQNIHSNLKKGGIYIFDIFNFEAITDDIIDCFKVDIQNEVNGVMVHHTQYSEIDKTNQLLISHDRNIYSREGEAPDIQTHSFSLQIYSATELQELLAENGFETLQQYDIEGNILSPEKSLNILTVARKKQS